ncbi:MAG: RNA-binding domain-containing protein [Candidatus Methanomethylicia archaeon]
MKIIIKSEVKPTEDEEKVRKAILNIINSETIKLIEENGVKTLIAEGDNIEVLSKLRETLRRRRILTTAKAILKRSIMENKIAFYLNKQAAYMGQVSFCEKDGESPLGPITIEISCNNIDEINEAINWLTSE